MMKLKNILQKLNASSKNIRYGFLFFHVIQFKKFYYKGCFKVKLYNTMTRKKEEFVSITKNEVKMYVCGPTVYNFFHIGNARCFIIFDMLRRYLEYCGYNVKMVQNFTDIDDKMIKGANEEGITITKLADKYIKEYYKDAKGLGIKKASITPKATEHIDDILAFIKILVENGYAYEAKGDVYFRTGSFKEYGKLSRHNLDDLEAGARVETDLKKENPMDFALWKTKKQGEPSWNSPWGEGRPGWHIECSVMANKYLGKTIDIHAGGQDLIFPHHENEIAQSEAVNKVPFARYWLHNGYINVDNVKMSKSLGNFFTVRDIIKKFDYEVIRFFILSAHYRSPVNFSDELLQQSKNGLFRIYKCVDTLKYLLNTKNEQIDKKEEELYSEIKKYKEKFIKAMDNDINTADAIAVIFEIVKEINMAVKEKKIYSNQLIKKLIDLIYELSDILGILYKRQDESIDNDLQVLIDQRNKARKEKDWAKADMIRDELKEKGIILEDTPQGVKVCYIQK